MLSIMLPPRVSTLPRHGRPAALLTCLLVCLVTLAAAAASAHATSYAYSELARFGGFDFSAYNNGHYGGSLTPGKFVDPAGFAVDTEYNKGNPAETVFVIDRTSGTEGATTSWRLQELSATDLVMGTTTFTLPNEPSTSRSGILGLAVDAAEERVYALVVGNTEVGESEVPFAKEVVAWSTQPEAGKLVAAKEGGSALPSDPLGSTGGVISTEAQLTADGVMYVPQGIALDVTGGQRDLAIEASDGTTDGKTGVSGVPGVALVQQVSTEGAKKGELLKKWSASSLTKPAGENEAAPLGISTDPDGTLDVLVGSVVGDVSDVDAVKLSADLSSSQQLLDSENTPFDVDRSPANLAPPPGPYGPYTAQPVGAGPGLVQLADGEGLYAATYQRDAVSDPESPEGTNYYWTDATPTLGGIANVGLRLLLPNAGGEISDAKGDTIVNTIGYSKLLNGEAQAGGVCNLDGEAEALAAGKNGTLWVLGRGFDTVAVSSDEGLGATVGREIVEFGPGANGEKACPQPSGTFSVSKPEVSEGATVTFNAGTVDLQQGVPFTYEWAPTGEGFTIVNEIGLWPRELEKSIVEELSWPPATTSYKYTQAGKYTVKLRIRSDYGTYEPPAQTITVTPPKPPVAKFSVATSEPTAGQPVTFNVSESSVPSGDSITDYRWEWGDGSKPEEDQSSGPTFAHTFAAAGVYTVKLIVTDSEELQSEAFSESVTVASVEKPATTTSTTTSPTQETPPASTAAKQETPLVVKPGSASQPKPLTDAQKLANALKACKKKPKKQRASCEKQAKKRYAPKAKKKSKKKKKK
jgi:PKD repeat protein